MRTSDGSLGEGRREEAEPHGPTPSTWRAIFSAAVARLRDDFPLSSPEEPRESGRDGARPVLCSLAWFSVAWRISRHCHHRWVLWGSRSMARKASKEGA